MEPLVDFIQVTAGQGQRPVLYDLDWSIFRHEHWLISGEMNSGKTTLLKLILGQGRIWKGHVTHPYFVPSDFTADRFKAIKLVSFTDSSHLFHNANAIHYYQQRYHATETEGLLTVQEYLASGGLDPNDSWHKELLDLFLLTDLLPLERIKLSSGQTRKMLLARALLGSPKLLLLDQPYLGMDTQSRASFNNLLDALVQRFDLTLVIAADHAHLPKCITHNFHLSKGAGTVRPTKPPELVVNDVEVPESLKETYRTLSKTPDYFSAIRFKSVNVRYGQNRILHDFNWQVQAGEKWVVFGPNGAGKSTLLALVYGDHPQAYANEIYLFDRPRGSGESIWDIKKRTGFISPEVHAFFRANQTATQLILTGLDDRWVFRGQSAPHATAMIHDLLDYFSLTEYADQPFHQLSTGTQRLLFFIRALMKAPNLLLLDEPFQGLDQINMTKAKILLEHILDERHNLVFISHYSHEIPSIVQHQLNL